MNKATALQLLVAQPCAEADAVRLAARALGVTRQAIYAWPADGHLPRVVADRVLAAAVRRRGKALQAAGKRVSALELDAITLPE